MIWENGIKTCIISYKKRIASPGSMQDTGSLGLVHGDGMTQRDSMEREVGERFRMGNTCIPVANACRSMEKPIQYCKVKKKKSGGSDLLGK